MGREAFACPKHMVFGPCGGVRDGGACEVAEDPCVFLERSPLPWPEPVERGAQLPTAEAMRKRLRAGRVVVADIPARPLDAGSLRRSAQRLSGAVDAVLLGDSPAQRVQFPPVYRAQLVAGEGLRVWSGVNARDRNRVAIEGELAALADVGVAGVHSVTGDHTLSGSRPDAAPVFDLDAPRIAALARGFGHLVSVAESPAAAPAAVRPARLVEKVRAGADVCFVDHCGGADAVRAFIDGVHLLGAAPVFLACVPVVLDRASARLLASFPALVPPEGLLDRILSAADPHREGIAAAVELSERMLQIPGVAGVNLSGGPGDGGEHRFTEALAAIGTAIRDRSPVPT